MFGVKGTIDVDTLFSVRRVKIMWFASSNLKRDSTDVERRYIL